MTHPLWVVASPTCLDDTQEQKGHCYLSGVINHSVWREEGRGAESVSIRVHSTCTHMWNYRYIHIMCTCALSQCAYVSEKLSLLIFKPHLRMTLTHFMRPWIINKPDRGKHANLVWKLESFRDVEQNWVNTLCKHILHILWMRNPAQRETVYFNDLRIEKGEVLLYQARLYSERKVQVGSSRGY